MGGLWSLGAVYAEAIKIKANCETGEDAVNLLQGLFKWGDEGAGSGRLR
jgi:hypothetical protein